MSPTKAIRRPLPIRPTPLVGTAASQNLQRRAIAGRVGIVGLVDQLQSASPFPSRVQKNGFPRAAALQTATSVPEQPQTITPDPRTKASAQAKAPSAVHRKMPSGDWMHFEHRVIAAMNGTRHSDITGQLNVAASAANNLALSPNSTDLCCQALRMAAQHIRSFDVRVHNRNAHRAPARQTSPPFPARCPQRSQRLPNAPPPPSSPAPHAGAPFLARGEISPGWFMPISITANSVSCGIRANVNGTPQWLL